MLTCCPSATPHMTRGLTLGPPHPGTICVAQETLGLRWKRFSRFVMLLMPAFSLPCAPPALTGPASLHRERSPTNASQKATRSAASALGLSPVEFSAQHSLTSELLRFL